MVAVVSDRVSRNAPERDFERLFDAEYVRVVAIARRILGDGHVAEDVAQDVFWQYYRAHRPDAPYARPWLYRAAAHTALNVLRAEGRRRRRETVVETATRRSREVPAGEQDPLRAVEREEQAREVRATLSRLSRKSATVLVLRYSGLSYAEVAQALGVSTGQIGTLLRRAETAFKKEMTRGTSE